MTGNDKLRNIGPKSAAWLRQVGVRTQEDLRTLGAVEAFMRVKRAGFKPSLNLLYALEGALLDCHWQEVPDDRRSELVIAVDAAVAQLKPSRGRAAAATVGPVTYIAGDAEDDAGSAPDGLFDSPDAGSGDD